MGTDPLVRRANMGMVLVMVSVLVLFVACSGMNWGGKAETGLAIAGQLYMLAEAYCSVQCPAMTPEHQAQWRLYLAGWKLALETGRNWMGYCQRWYQFQQGY